MELCFNRMLLFSRSLSGQSICRNAQAWSGHTQVTGHCRQPILLLLVCLIHLEQNEAKSIILLCPTKLLFTEIYIQYIAAFGGWQPQNSKSSSIYHPSELCAHPISVSYICSSWQCLHLSTYFPSQPEHPTLLFLPLRCSTQSLIGFLPNQRCIQQSSL